MTVRENKSWYYLSETCPRYSERVNFQSSSILNWFIKHHERIKSFSIFASVVYKTFYYQGKQTLLHFLEKLLMTKAIYQLNKYNKAWLNTNLAKTPTLLLRRRAKLRIRAAQLPKLQLRDIRMSRSCFGNSLRYFQVVSCILSGKEIIMRNK